MDWLRYAPTAISVGVCHAGCDILKRLHWQCISFEETNVELSIFSENLKTGIYFINLKRRLPLKIIPSRYCFPNNALASTLSFEADCNGIKS